MRLPALMRRCVRMQLRPRYATRRLQCGRRAMSSSTSFDVDALPTRLAQLSEESSPLPQDRIRNFSIIAHVDHGKSTLADRLLESTGNIPSLDKGKAQFLDTLKVERERGITVKAQTASMLFTDKACEGALLLVDAAQGIQAQTLATYRSALDEGLTIIPIITKLDLPHADPDRVMLSMSEVFEVDIDDILLTSAKSGIGVDEVLPAVIDRIPSPAGRVDGGMRCLLVDSWYDPYRGAICLVQVTDGEVTEGMKLASFNRTYNKKGRTEVEKKSLGSNRNQDAFSAYYEVQEVGLLLPFRCRTGRLRTGQVGYIIAGMKSTKEATVGDTLVLHDPQATIVRNTEEKAVGEGEGMGEVSEAAVSVVDRQGRSLVALPGFREPKAMVFASIYAIEQGQHKDLTDALEKLCLNDASVDMGPESSPSLGLGFRCGFLGLLHMEVFHQRLKDEYDIPVLVTAPMVSYTVLGPAEGQVRLVECPSDFPDASDFGIKQTKIMEPMVRATIVGPSEYLGAVLTSLKARRGEQQDLVYLSDSRVLLEYLVPWQEVVLDFHDELKSITSGYASMDYEEAEPRLADIVKVAVLLNSEPLDALSFVCHRSKAETMGRSVIKRLRDEIDRQQFEIIVQASLGKKVFARERIAPYRKNVLIKSGKSVGGGDVTRKQKLLQKQKKGKARMKTLAKVPLSQKAFWAVMQKR